MSSYDHFAWFYDRYWAAPMQEWQVPTLHRLLLNALPPAAHLLDVCCGVGHLARHLTNLGFSVTGVDSSEGMLAFARRNAPHARFLHQSVDHLTLTTPVEAALCTFDSVNHILTPDLLLALFLNIRKNLKPGGVFLFDANTPESYGERWDAAATVVEPDHAFFLRGRFDPLSSLGHTEVTMFRLPDPAQPNWQRTDAVFAQRPWTASQLTELLHTAGFSSVEHWHAQRDLQLSGHYGLGRIYMRAC